MNITDYLKSEQAREDVAELLAKTPDPAGGRGRWHAIPVPLASLTAMPDRAWTRVDILFLEIDAAHPARVYFRPEGERFIITDLGEAVHALRLRTGICVDEASVRLAELLGRDGAPYPKDSDIRDYPTLADLPAALCRVLLAANVVSTMDLAK